MKTTQQGFTLIKLMIVVAIIAILAAIAIPQYQTYVVRSQVTRVMGEAGDQKIVAEDCLNNGGDTIENGADVGACIPTATSSDLMSDDLDYTLNGQGTSTIKATFGNHANAKIDGKSLTWTRNSSGNWSCKTSVNTKYAPSSCPNG